jgi:hypothetical protein
MIEHIEQGTLPRGKRAVIALTSWKRRINSVGLTIFSLYDRCGPAFHIVLTLSEDEFPKKERELPKDLMLLNRFGIVEILWVKKNYKSFKKSAFVQLRYKTVPVITADDGCVYTFNYADVLYKEWQRNKKSIIGFKEFKSCKIPCFGSGYGVIYPPYCFKDYAVTAIEKYAPILIQNPNDDRFIGNLCHFMRIPLEELGGNRKTFIDIDNDGLSTNGSYIGGFDWIFADIIQNILYNKGK